MKQMDLFQPTPHVKKGAEISGCGRYRYQLWRIWDESLPKVLWIMHNPSKADEIDDDPTVTRIINFSKAWGYGGIYVGNISPYRATNPKDMDSIPSHILLPSLNILNIKWMAEKCSLHILAHGILHKNIRNWAFQTFDLNHIKFHTLSKTKNGFPGHPLYLKSNLKPIPF